MRGGGGRGGPPLCERDMAEPEVLDSLALVVGPDRGGPRQPLAVDAVDTWFEAATWACQGSMAIAKKCILDVTPANEMASWSDA